MKLLCNIRVRIKEPMQQKNTAEVSLIDSKGTVICQLPDVPMDADHRFLIGPVTIDVQTTFHADGMPPP